MALSRQGLAPADLGPSSWLDNAGLWRQSSNQGERPVPVASNGWGSGDAQEARLKVATMKMPSPS